MNKDGLAAAIDLYSKAIDLDADFALPYVGLAESYVADTVFGNAERDAEAIYAPARKAVEIDPQDASAHSSLAAAHFFNRDHPSAIAEATLALQLSPSDAHAHLWLGFPQVYSGLAEDARENFRLAMELSPRDPLLSQMQGCMAHALLHLQRYEESLEWSRKALQQPNVPWPARAYYLSALVQLERSDEVGKALADLLEHQPQCTISVVQRMPFTDEAYHDRLVEALRKAGLPEE